MIEFLVDEAKERGVTEISLDATDDGRKLYEAMGWHENSEAMVKDLYKKTILTVRLKQPVNYSSL